MKRLINNELTHESWEEYADHSLTGDDIIIPVETLMQSDAS